jgi:uncharacterized protein with PIN domain
MTKVVEVALSDRPDEEMGRRIDQLIEEAKAEVESVSGRTKVSRRINELQRIPK